MRWRVGDTLASERIAVAGTYNFREVGGLPASGGAIRRGKLFRSDGLHNLGESGRAELDEIGIRTVIDLRDEFESTAMPDDIEGLGIDVVRLPVFEGSAASQSVIGLDLAGLYRKILSEHSASVVEAIRVIIGSGDSPVLVHCTAGKDRTGVVIALVLLSVGVDRRDVVADYAATEQNLSGEWLTKMIRTLDEHGIPDTPQIRALMSGSPPEALEATIDFIGETQGSARAYLLESGITEAELLLLNTVLVSP